MKNKGIIAQAFCGVVCISLGCDSDSAPVPMNILSTSKATQPYEAVMV